MLYNYLIFNNFVNIYYLLYFWKNNYLKHNLLYFIIFYLLSLPFKGQTSLPLKTATNLQTEFQLYLEAGTLYIKGLEGTGKIQIYSIIGNLIYNLDIQQFKNLQLPVQLEEKQMYIIRIESLTFQKTIKIVNS